MVAAVVLCVAFASHGDMTDLSTELSSGVMVSHVHQTSVCVIEVQDPPREVRTDFRDLRLPRAPRHRSERPVSAVEDIEDVIAVAEPFGFFADAMRCLFTIEEAPCSALDGHPLSLLRPPSFSAT